MASQRSRGVMLLFPQIHHLIIEQAETKIRDNKLERCTDHFATRLSVPFPQNPLHAFLSAARVIIVR
jgi:hypothetical protein